jgi:hypothetical protein
MSYQTGRAHWIHVSLSRRLDRHLVLARLAEQQHVVRERRPAHAESRCSVWNIRLCAFVRIACGLRVLVDRDLAVEDPAGGL